MEPSNQTNNRGDKFGRAMGALKGMPDVINTSATTVRTVIAMIGTPQTYIVQTFRKLKDPEGGSEGTGDTLFIEYIDDEGVQRMAIPPAITKIIQRQRDSLSARTRKRGAKAGYETRKAKGTQRSFSKRKKVTS